MHAPPPDAASRSRRVHCLRAPAACSSGSSSPLSPTLLFLRLWRLGPCRRPPSLPCCRRRLWLRPRKHRFVQLQLSHHLCEAQREANAEHAGDSGRRALALDAAHCHPRTRRREPEAARGRRKGKEERGFPAAPRLSGGTQGRWAARTAERPIETTHNHTPPSELTPHTPHRSAGGTRQSRAALRRAARALRTREQQDRRSVPPSCPAAPGVSTPAAHLQRGAPRHRAVVVQRVRRRVARQERPRHVRVPLQVNNLRTQQQNPVGRAFFKLVRTSFAVRASYGRAPKGRNRATQSPRGDPRGTRRAQQKRARREPDNTTLRNRSLSPPSLPPN